MKKLFFMVLSFLFVGSVSHASCRNPAEAGPAQHALVDARVMGITSLSDFASVEVRECHPDYVERTLGLPGLAMARPSVCGLMIGFYSREGEESFARSMRALKRSVTVRENGAPVEVPLCGFVVPSEVPSIR